MSSNLRALHDTAEARRSIAADSGLQNWRAWGPYLSEQTWGTVREDYSEDGSAWEYFPHDHARSRAYRWNEDGLAGLCDADQVFCFAQVCPVPRRRHRHRAPRLLWKQGHPDCRSRRSRPPPCLDFPRRHPRPPPVFGDTGLFQTHPDGHDLLPFHGDTGRGAGASYQTGWTALVADLVMRSADRAASSNQP